MNLRSKQSKAHGFSLTELMLIVALIGIVSALIGPTFLQALNSDRLRTAALALTGYLDTVRREAMAKSVTCTIAMSNAAIVSASPSPNCGGRTADLREEGGSASITVASPTVSAVGFTPQGTSTSTSNKEFILSLPGHGTELCVKIYSPLGFIRQGDRAVGGTCNYTGT